MSVASLMTQLADACRAATGTENKLSFEKMVDTAVDLLKGGTGGAVPLVDTTMTLTRQTENSRIYTSADLKGLESYLLYFECISVSASIYDDCIIIWSNWFSDDRTFIASQYHNSGFKWKIGSKSTGVNPTTGGVYVAPEANYIQAGDYRLRIWGKEALVNVL